MRKLLNTLFVLTDTSYLSLDGENVVVNVDRSEIARFPLHTLEGILCFTYGGASPALIGACAQRGVDLVFFSPQGRFLARTVGEERGNVLLRKQQYRISDDPFASCQFARGFLLGKVYNSRWVLERATRDHPQRVPVERLKELSCQLAETLPRIEQAGTTEELRGFEGEAAQRYFEGFDHLILQQRETFTFSKRSRRPPLDPINALLSFAYTLLSRECAAALEGVGLDPYVGFLHRPRPGRTSLALDLMEELRSCYHKLPEKIRVVGCWAHARRKFDEALQTLPKDKRQGSPAAVGECYCTKLFQLEETLSELTAEERYNKRLELEKPVLDALLAWAEDASVKTAPKSALGKALHYLREQWPYLIRYLEDGRLELSNNRAERSIKPFVMGRKNWLFSNTPAGAQSSAVIYSLIETAKENDLDPYRYLVWLLHNAPEQSQKDEDWPESFLPVNAPKECRS